jgi:hypothetical protein
VDNTYTVVDVEPESFVCELYTLSVKTTSNAESDGAIAERSGYRRGLSAVSKLLHESSVLV